MEPTLCDLDDARTLPGVSRARADAVGVFNLRRLLRQGVVTRSADPARSVEDEPPSGRIALLPPEPHEARATILPRSPSVSRLLVAPSCALPGTPFVIATHHGVRFVAALAPIAPAALRRPRALPNSAFAALALFALVAAALSLLVLAGAQVTLG